MFGSSALGFCGWDIVTVVILAVVVAVILIQARQHQKQNKEIRDMKAIETEDKALSE